MNENLQLNIRISSGMSNGNLQFGIFKKNSNSKWNSEQNLVMDDIMESDNYTKNILLGEGYFYFGFLNTIDIDDFEVEIQAKDINTNTVINEYEGSIEISPYMYFYSYSNGKIIDAMTKTKSFTVCGHLEVDNIEMDAESSINIIGTIIVKNNIKFTGINSFINIQKDGTLLQLKENAIIDTSIKFSKLQRDTRIDIKELKLTTVDKTAKIKLKIEKDEPYVFIVPDIITPDTDSDTDSNDLIPPIIINELNIEPVKKKNSKEDIKNKGRVVVVFPPKIKIEFKVLNFN